LDATPAGPPNAPRRSVDGRIAMTRGENRRTRAPGGTAHRLAVTGAADPQICATAAIAMLLESMTYGRADSL
jgi:hypothetical protein